MNKENIVKTVAAKRAMALKFAELYSRYANGRRAAIEAGYSEKNAAAQASKLLRRKLVQDQLAAYNVKSSVHAEQTYRELLMVKDAALAELHEALTQTPKHPDRVRAAIRCAGRELERVGRAEGLFIERHEHKGSVDVVVTLQNLVQKSKAYIETEGRTVGRLEEALKDATVLPVVEPPPGADTNGHKAGDAPAGEVK